MKKIITKGGSITYYCSKYGEYYHSLTGAMEEAVKKYAEPCRIAELASEKGDITILDVCFGLGYNSAAAIDTALSANPHCRVRILALENDQKILDETKNLRPGFRNYDIIKNIAEMRDAKEGGVEIEMLFGDAREKMKEVSEKADAVFLDPFSPKKCPELWTEEFFRDISRVMRKGAILATYSCARSVRENLSKAGLEVRDGPVVGRWAPGTIAVK
ncbi:MAG: MnmC family methyltransferase [Candidatus Woesearchaeota archaeon]